MAFESRHDADSLGPLLAEPANKGEPARELVGLLDLVRNLAARSGDPLGHAAQGCVTTLVDGDERPLFFTQPHLRAVQVCPTHLIATGHPKNFCGRAGALRVLGLTWCKGLFARADGRPKQQALFARLQRLAILKADAEVLFPKLFELAESIPDDVQADAPEPSILQPEGGQWPHRKGEAWTDAERVALFLMRHRDKLGGDELVRIAGVSRQRISELIGGANPHGGIAKAKGEGGWTPSAELLAACGQPLQPLQSAARALTT